MYKLFLLQKMVKLFLYRLFLLTISENLQETNKLKRCMDIS